MDAEEDFEKQSSQGPRKYKKTGYILFAKIFEFVI